MSEDGMTSEDWRDIAKSAVACCKQLGAERDAAIAQAEKAKAQIGSLIDALLAIVARSENGELGTSKVVDMARIARDALAPTRPDTADG